MSRPPAVLLLHDQLMDSRIWHGFGDLISTYARPIPVPAPAQTEFYAVPSGWTRHLGASVRTLLDRYGPVELTIATGWAVGTALSLVDGGLSRQALLINPGPMPALLDDDRQASDLDSLTPQERAQILAAVPHPMPEPTGGWADELRDGVVGPEAAAYFMEFAAEPPGVLTEEHQRLVGQIQTENLARLLPLSLAEIRAADLGQEPDWVPLVVRHTRQCAAAFSGLPSRYEHMLSLLHREAPGLLLVELGLSSSLPWLEDPGRLDQLVRDLLARG